MALNGEMCYLIFRNILRNGKLRNGSFNLIQKKFRHRNGTENYHTRLQKAPYPPLPMQIPRNIFRLGG